VHWYVPFGQNSKFIGREEYLREIITALTPEEFERDCQRVAITGLGGVGKTQIALEAAFRIRDKHPDCSVFWISAVNVPSFDAGFLEICRQFKVPGIDEDKADVKSLAKAYLSQETAGRWLLIIDNADDLDMLYKSVKESDGNVSSPALAEYLPFSRKGSILFTTRNHKAAIYQAGSNVVTVKEMTDSDSLQILETSLIEKGKALIEDDAKKLVRHLTNLPLAIKQAAAFINQNKMTISNYLELYESSALSDQRLIKLLSIDFEDHGRYRSVQNPIISTWLISFLEIQKSDPLAARYLYIMSCVAQRDIPRCLLPSASKFDEIQAIGTLKAYAFITELEDRNSFDIHRLVQLAARNWLKTRGELFQRSGDTLKQVSRIFPFFEHENKNVCIAYLPHAQYVLTFQDFPEDSQESLRVLLYNIGVYFFQTGKYKEAEEFHRRTLELNKQVLGEGHPVTLASMSNLAIVYGQQGEYAKAETLQQQTLELKKQVLGENHPDTLASISNLSIVYGQQGEYVKAETLQQQALELNKQVLGEGHPDTLGSMSNLAMVYQGQGKYIEAETLLQQALELRKQALGEDHPDTLGSMNNLAVVYQGQGKYIEAETLQQQALELKKQALGEDHPDTLASINNLAVVYRGQGKYIEAETLLQQALELRNQALGEDHPVTLASKSNLALV
jgi:tetratricopeptide (TPR) repeat protein